MKYPPKIDKFCETSVNPRADKPECGSYPTTNGAGRVASEEADVDSNDAGLYCGSRFPNPGADGCGAPSTSIRKFVRGFWRVQR